MQQEAEQMLQTTYVTHNPLGARQTSLHGEARHKESWPSPGQVRLEEVTSWLWDGKVDKDFMQVRTEQGDQSEVRKSSIHEQVRLVLPGQPLLHLPGTDPVQFSAQHNLTSLSLSAPSTRGSTACELPGRSKRNNPSICPGCWVWAGNSLLSGSNRGSSCPQELGDKFWPYQFANGLIFLLMQDLSLPLLALVSSEAELGEVGPAPKRQSWGAALWAKGEDVPSTIPCWRPGNGNLPGRGFCSFPPQRGTVKLGRAVLPALTAGSSCLK